MNRIEILKEMIAKQPGDIFLHYALAMESMSAGETETAIEKLEFIRSVQADYLPLYYQLAHLYEQCGRKDEAILTYESGIEIALTQGDKKTTSELRSALEELQY